MGIAPQEIKIQAVQIKAPLGETWPEGPPNSHILARKTTAWETSHKADTDIRPNATIGLLLT